MDEVFQVDGKYVLIDHVPASVRTRCGEEAFSWETTEGVRLLIHGQAKPIRSVALEVFEYA